MEKITARVTDKQFKYLKKRMKDNSYKSIAETVRELINDYL
jgi:Arc/MetJ-type ribon-helix-helix transcriptional regulator